jgi:membrane fusion protein, multidrug efflux system
MGTGVRGVHILIMTMSDTVTAVRPEHSRFRLWIIGFLLLAASAGAYWYWFARAETPRPPAGRFRGMGGGPNQAVPVRIVPVQQGTIDVAVDALGTVTPLQTVAVRSRIDGELVRVLFTEGQRVSSGDLLAEIDARQYQVQLSQAQGQLDENQARLKNAQSDLERYRRLASEGLITTQQVTTQEALVQQYQGALQANEAQVNNARLQLTYTKIRAPIDGRLGLRQVDPGNLIRSGDANGLVVITQMRPISVLFTVPEAELPPVLAALRQGKRLPVQAWDRSQKVLLAEGELQTVDNQIDTATGTIKLRARFANDQEQLFPNQFVNIRLRVSTLEGATVIPSAAVQRGSFGTFVYAVKPDSKVTIKKVALGPAEGDRVAVTTGLDGSERIVIEGVDDLTEGAKVEIISDTAQPEAAGGDASAPAGRATGRGR